MNPISMFRFNRGAGALVLIAAAVLQSVDAQESHAPEVPEAVCSVSDEDIVAATTRQQVMLDTEACTASLNLMVDSTFSNVQNAYAAFYKQIHLSPEGTAAVSLLLVRRQLLSGSWSAAHVEHFAISKDPALLNETEERLQEHLTPQEIASLKRYEETLPARSLIEPVVSRLKKKGRPLSEVQYEAALQAAQQFHADWYKRVPPKTSTDVRQRCIDSNARMNHRDEHIREILARSLDDEQLEIAQGYYRDLFERRARMFQIYESKLASDGAAFCAIPAL